MPQHSAVPALLPSIRHRGQHRLPLLQRSARTSAVLVAVVTLVAGLIAVMGTGGASTTTTTQHTAFGATVSPVAGQTVSQTLASEDSTFGHMKVWRAFYSGLPAPWPGYAGAGNREVVVSFNAQPSEILSGRDDTRLRAWFATAPRSYPVYWIYFHEPEDNIAAGQFTAAAYRAAWAHLRVLQQQAKRMDLKSTLNLMCWTFSPHSGRSWSSYYPGSGVIDTMAYDCYNSGRKSNTPTYLAPSSMMGNAIAVAKQLHKPFGIAEIGSMRLASDPSGVHRAAWLTSAASYLRGQGAVFVTYFNNYQRGAPDFRLTDRPSQLAWRAAVAS